MATGRNTPPAGRSKPKKSAKRPSAGRGVAAPSDGSDDDDGGYDPTIGDTSLAREAERRYLNYALSVITSRALPDVRDGLKPVQRRILYAMYNDLGLKPAARYRKSAAVVGEVMGKYHPHGDTAIYDAMVRLAQPFVMSAPLVDGQGNFGSPDGDSAAAMRYTEAKLQKLAAELLAELGQDTVAFRDNYDGTQSEPVVLPARFPNLLVNGAQGIAVGMATSMPPHNLGEVIDACVSMIDDSDISLKDLLKNIQGPDFPTGGQLLASRAELTSIYETGHGGVKLRGQWKHQEGKRRGENDSIILTSMPYVVERRAIVEKIAEIIIAKKLPPLLDVRDESTEIVRVVLELKKGTDPGLVMAYLYKHTPLQTNVQFNLTCLIPSEGDAPPVPRRLGLQEIISQFLDFRFLTVTRRIEYQLAVLLRRIHILEGFEIIFDALDQAIRIIRRSEGKADAAVKLIGRFGLSPEQAEAVLELKLYRLAKLEILAIQRELAEKRAAARKLQALLNSEGSRWQLVRDELLELKDQFAQKRRTQIKARVQEAQFQAEDYIAEEDGIVILCQSGWVKRVKQVKDVNSTRMRDGDVVIAAAIGSTRSSIAFFSNLGTCYVTRMHDVPQATGYGDPIQKLFRLKDGERIVAMTGFDHRVLEVPPVVDAKAEASEPFALAVTRRGMGLRFSLRNHAEPSTRAGRKFARLRNDDEVIQVVPVGLYEQNDWVMCAASDGHAIAVNVEDVPVLASAGKGVMVIKLKPKVSLLGATLGWYDLDAIEVKSKSGKSRSLTLQSLRATRGGRGSAVVKRGGLSEMVIPPVETPYLESEEE